MQVKAISACRTRATTATDDVAMVFSALYAENFAAVRQYLEWRTYDRRLADELAQETFVMVWERMSDGRVALADPEHAIGFLVHRAKWVLASHYRASQRRPEYLLTDRHFVRRGR
jgi:DNA-directed RNA polymerase specialized sigma24 family protein